MARRYGRFDFYQSVYKGDYIAAHDEDGASVIDRTGRRYRLTKYLTPSTIVYTSENNVFKAYDFMKGKTGYFTITVRGGDTNVGK
jgi:hypothetical protein